MKDALGHGSDTRGSSYNAATAAVAPAHQSGVMKAAGTPEEYVQAGGKLPTEAQHADLERQNTAWIAGWGSNPSDAGKQAIARLQDELDRSRANRAKFGSEENPTPYTQKLRGADPYMAGRNARQSGADRTANPHINPALQKEWHRGWRQGSSSGLKKGMVRIQK